MDAKSNSDERMPSKQEVRLALRAQHRKLQKIGETTWSSKIVYIRRKGNCASILSYITMRLVMLVLDVQIEVDTLPRVLQNQVQVKVR